MGHWLTRQAAFEVFRLQHRSDGEVQGATKSTLRCHSNLRRSIVSKLKEAEARQEVQRKLLSEYRWRLNALDKRMAEAAQASDVDSKGADSLWI